MEGALVFTIICAFISCVTSFNACNEKVESMHPKNFTKEPYCETAKIQEVEYKRCWKTTEVDPAD